MFEGYQKIDRILLPIILGFFVVAGIGMTIKGMKLRDTRAAIKDECELADFDIEHALTTFEENNALLVKQNLILQGKCK